MSIDAPRPPAAPVDARLRHRGGEPAAVDLPAAPSALALPPAPRAGGALATPTRPFGASVMARVRAQLLRNVSTPLAWLGASSVHAPEARLSPTAKLALTPQPFNSAAIGDVLGRRSRNDSRAALVLGDFVIDGNAPQPSLVQHALPFFTLQRRTVRIDRSDEAIQVLQPDAENVFRQINVPTSLAALLASSKVSTHKNALVRSLEDCTFTVHSTSMLSDDLIFVHMYKARRSDEDSYVLTLAMSSAGELEIAGAAAGFGKFGGLQTLQLSTHGSAQQLLAFDEYRAKLVSIDARGDVSVHGALPNAFAGQGLLPLISAIARAPNGDILIERRG